jgi:hypothetical protein
LILDRLLLYKWCNNIMCSESVSGVGVGVGAHVVGGDESAKSREHTDEQMRMSRERGRDLSKVHGS